MSSGVLVVCKLKREETETETKTGCVESNIHEELKSPKAFLVKFHVSA